MNEQRRTAIAGLRKPWRVGLWLVAAAAACAAVWLGGDHIYSRIVAARLARWETTHDRDANGVRDGCTAWSMGEGPTAILLIHGFADSPAVFLRMGERLASEGFACRAMRLPGSAEPVERMAEATADDWRAAIDAEVRELCSSHRRVILIGHSLGGTLALGHLLDAPGDADGLVLLAPLLRVSDARSPGLTAKGWFDVAGTVLRETQVVENYLPRDSATVSGDVTDRSDRFITRSVYENMFEVIADVGPRAAQLEHPLLVVVSDRDEIVDADAIEEFFGACRSSRKVLLHTAEAGHMIQFDPGWEDVAAAIVSFASGLADDPDVSASEERAADAGLPPA